MTISRGAAAMTCYKDRSYCWDAPECRYRNECGRYMTPAEKLKADASGLPVCWFVKCQRFEPLDGGRKEEAMRRPGLPVL